MIELGRRSLFGLLASSIGVAFARWRNGQTFDAQTIVDALLERFRSHDLAAVGGVVARESAAADPDSLAVKLMHDLGCDPGAGGPQIARALANRIRGDFAEGRVINIAGWRLSETEANLAVLAAHRYGDLG